MGHLPICPQKPGFRWRCTWCIFFIVKSQKAPEGPSLGRSGNGQGHGLQIAKSRVSAHLWPYRPCRGLQRPPLKSGMGCDSAEPRPVSRSMSGRDMEPSPQGGPTMCVRAPGRRHKHVTSHPGRNMGVTFRHLSVFSIISDEKTFEAQFVEMRPKPPSCPPRHPCMCRLPCGSVWLPRSPSAPASAVFHLNVSAHICVSRSA